MKRSPHFFALWILAALMISSGHAWAWYDETHLAIAKAAGYSKWFNATGADMLKLKMGALEADNHFVNNPPGTRVTPAMIKAQIDRYNRADPEGHLYGAIVHSVRDYIDARRQGKYGAYHLAFCAHYVGDLSMPLHNTPPTKFNRRHHKEIEAFVNEEGLEGLTRKITCYPIHIHSEADLMAEIARIANISIDLAHRLETENRILSHQEAYRQLSHSASLFKAIMRYVGAR
jgi:hypothetical protein